MTAALRQTPDATNLTPPTDATAYAGLVNNEVKALWKVSNTRLVSVSGTNDIVASNDSSIVSAITAYAQPMSFLLTPANTNTGAMTINIDGVGVVGLKDYLGAALASGTLFAGATYFITYDGANFRVIVGASPAVNLAANYAWTGTHSFNASSTNFGQGGTAAGLYSMVLNGPSSASGGVLVYFKKNATTNWSLGHYSALSGGGSSSDLLLWNHPVGQPAYTISYADNSIGFGSTVSGSSPTAASIKGKSLGLTENAYVGGVLDVAGAAAFHSSVLSSAAVGGIGYSVGAGGSITQPTNKNTAITLNTLCGEITLSNAALAGNTSVVFAFNNTSIALYDDVVVSIRAGYATAGSYQVVSEGTTLNSTRIHVRNVTGGSLSEALVLTFKVIKGTKT